MIENEVFFDDSDEQDRRLAMCLQHVKDLANAVGCLAVAVEELSVFLVHEQSKRTADACYKISVGLMQQLHEDIEQLKDPSEAE